MKNDELDDFFRDLDLDIAEPSDGHKERFLNKLKNRPTHGAKSGKLRMLWTPLIAVAASLLIIVALTGNNLNLNLNNSGDLAGISPEMKETQQFYTSLIKTELAKVNDAKTPETEAVVKDALTQLEKLDIEYENLKKDLKNSGQDKRVIFAMVSNLQQRIDLLNNVLIHIENIKELKNPENENNLI